VSIEVSEQDDKGALGAALAAQAPRKARSQGVSRQQEMGAKGGHQRPEFLRAKVIDKLRERSKERKYIPLFVESPPEVWDIFLDAQVEFARHVARSRPQILKGFDETKFRARAKTLEGALKGLGSAPMSGADIHVQDQTAKFVAHSKAAP